MKNDAKAALLFSLGVMGLLFVGCAAKKTDIVNAPVVPEAKVETIQTVPMAKYSVKKGDSLWAIAAQKKVYSDPFQWPLIFKTNRDQIRDPDQIEPGQVFLIQQGQTAEQTEHARQLANDTPAFVKQAKPRKTLPVNYF
jgi:hypothetical protein